MQVLRARQPAGLQVLQRLRRDIDARAVPALRGGERGHGDDLLPVPRQLAEEQQRRARFRVARRWVICGVGGAGIAPAGETADVGVALTGTVGVAAGPGVDAGCTGPLRPFASVFAAEEGGRLTSE
jgi:hypothetical protein